MIIRLEQFLKAYALNVNKELFFGEEAFRASLDDTGFPPKMLIKAMFGQFEQKIYLSTEMIFGTPLQSTIEGLRQLLNDFVRTYIVGESLGPYQVYEDEYGVIIYDPDDNE